MSRLTTLTFATERVILSHMALPADITLRGHAPVPNVMWNGKRTNDMKQTDADAYFIMIWILLMANTQHILKLLESFHKKIVIDSYE